MFIQEYNSPEGYSNIKMSSDGTYLTGLWFKNSKDSYKHKYNFEKKIYQYLIKQSTGWTFILVVKIQTLHLNIK